MEIQPRIKENSILARIATWKLESNSAAIVIGKTIYIYGVSKQDFQKNDRWVKHEMCHIRQFQRYGVFNFICKYLWESIRKGYYNNQYEIEARSAEKI